MNDNKDNPVELVQYEPIGHFHCDEKYRFEVPRQAVLADNQGYIELLPHQNYDQAIRDLEGFSRLWVIYQFHLNTRWRPFVRPPRMAADKKKISVFATRAPHRPNSIGLSCVEIVQIKGLRIYVKGFDILNGSPVLDVKPYIPYCDSFPDAETGWLPTHAPIEYTCTFSEQALEQVDLIYKTFQLDLNSFASLQLLHEPTNPQTKRIRVVNDDEQTYWLGCRTWRVYFKICEEDLTVHVYRIGTGYHDYELEPDAEDPYEDKQFHRDFMKRYPLADN